MVEVYVLFESGNITHQDAVVASVMQQYNATLVNVGTFLPTRQRDNTYKIHGMVDQMLIDTLAQTLSQQLGQPVTVTLDYLETDLGAHLAG